MKKREKALLLLPVSLFFITNLLYSSYFLSTETVNREKVKIKEKGVVLSSTAQGCSLACEELIDQKIAAALTNSFTTSSFLRTSYVPLGSGGSTTNTDWTALEGSEFNFNISNYSSRAKVYWEGNLKALSGNSRCYTRLYDKTHYREVDYSQQSTDQLSYQTLISQSTSIWLGNNQYEVQIKSLNGTRCYLSSPNLIVKY